MTAPKRSKLKKKIFLIYYLYQNLPLKAVTFKILYSFLMPRTTEDWIGYIEERLGLDYEFIKKNIEAGYWNYEYYEWIHQMANIAARPEEEVTVDPEVLTVLDDIMLQLGGGLTDSRMIIKEYDDDIIYVPSSPFCLPKCFEYIEKSIGGTRTLNDFIMFLKNHKHINQLGEVSTKVVKKAVEYCFNTDMQTSIVGLVYWRPKRQCWQLRQGDKSITKFRIGYVPFKCIPDKVDEKMPNRGHFVVFKGPHYIHVNNIPIEYFVRQDMNLHEQQSYSDFSPKLRKKQCVVWDLEAYRVTEGKEAGKFIEYAIGAMLLDISNLKNESFEERITRCANESYSQFVGPACFTEFLEWCSRLNIKSLQCWAHNSGQFDTLLLRQVANPALRFTDKIENNSKRVIMQKIKYADGPDIIFKDTCAFLSMPLSVLCKSFDTHYRKSSMEHSTITKENYLARIEEWAPYLKLDVLSLAEVMLKFESAIWQYYGESMTTNLTVSSISSSLMRKACYMKEVYIIKDPVAQCMIQLSCLGGRIFHTMTKPNQTLIDEAVKRLYSTYYPELYEEHKAFIDSSMNKTICMDANKLYLAAMKMGSFPIRYAREHADYTKLKEELINGTFEGRAICDVTMESPPIFLPPVPVKTNSYGNYFPVGMFRQSMNDIDIQEAIRFGYKLHEIHGCIYWKSHAKFFEPLMQYIYEIGLKFAKEKNAAAVTTNKLIGNSTYGVNLKRPIETQFSYAVRGDKALNKARKLANGQIEYEWRTVPQLVCAPQIGSFVLAYSRVIMNRLLEKVHGNEIPNIIYYGDTDSYYLSLALLPIINLDSGLMNFMEPDISLGGFKNDYEPGVLIEDFRFIGPKRYSLKMAAPFNKTDADLMMEMKADDISVKTQEWFEDLRINDEHKLAAMELCESIINKTEGPQTEEQSMFAKKTFYKHKMCGVHFMSERERNISDNLPLIDGMTIEKLPDDKTFFEQVDEYSTGKRQNIRWFQDVWRRRESGVFIYNRQLKSLSAATPRRHFTNDGSSLPLFTEQTQRETGRNHLNSDEIQVIPVQPKRDYTIKAFTYDPHRLGKRFPPSFAGLKQAMVTDDPRLSTCFITKGTKVSKKVGMMDCDEIKMAFRRYYKEDNKLYECYQVVDMTFAGPKHREDSKIYDRKELMDEYRYVLLSNMKFLTNELTRGDPSAIRFISNIQQALKDPNALYKTNARQKKTRKAIKSKHKISEEFPQVFAENVDLSKFKYWPTQLRILFSSVLTDEWKEYENSLKGKLKKAFQLWKANYHMRGFFEGFEIYKEEEKDEPDE